MTIRQRDRQLTGVLQLSRRRFLHTGIAATMYPAAIASGDPTASEPQVAEPRATSGDVRCEPSWEKRLTIRVSPTPTSDADLVGANERAIQAAVDYAARRGGGTVHLLPGVFRLRNAVYLADRLRLTGSGEKTVLIKEPSSASPLIADSDWYDQEITLADAAGFRVGDGVVLETTNPHNGGHDVVKRTLVAQSGNRFKLDRGLRKNFWLSGKSKASTLFPLLSGDGVRQIVIENLVLDGNREANDNLNGNYGGCIFLQDCRDIAIRDVTARNYNGDGISWQICHDVIVERCQSIGNADLGLHPGSGSQRSVVRNNLVRDNGNIGVFFCWGVRYGVCEKNRIEANGTGVSIGHRDTHNLIRDNDIVDNRRVGVLFRPERGRAFAPHHNRLEQNRIRDNGPADGVAVDVQGEVEDVRIVGNQIEETRQPMQRVGIRIGPKTKDIYLADNRISGFATMVDDQRTG